MADYGGVVLCRAAVYPLDGDRCPADDYGAPASSSENSNTTVGETE